MRDPVIRIGGFLGAVDHRIGAQDNRRAADVGDTLVDGEHILVIDRDLEHENLALAVVPAQRDR